MKKGWTVTLAGTYSDQIPDVQMHLSFPKRSSSQSRKLDKSTHSHQSIDQPKDTDMDLDTNSNYNDTDSQKPEAKPAILPPSTPQSIKLNPKRSLTKNYFNAGICSFEIRNDKKAHRHMNMIWFFCIFFGPQIDAYSDLQQQQQQHSKLVSHRKFSFDSNGNANIYQRSAKQYYNLPNIHDHRPTDQANRTIAKQTAKKTIKVFTAIDYPVL